MFSFLTLFLITLAEVTFNSVIQIENYATKTKLGIVYDGNDARYKKPTITTTNPPFNDDWNWNIIDPHNAKSTEIVHCGQKIYLYNAFHEMYINVRNDESQNKNVVFASKVPNDRMSLFSIECKEQGNLHQRDEFFLKSDDANCYLYTTFNAEHPEMPYAFLVNCSSINTKSIWSVEGGIFILPEVEESETHSDEL
ncbi:hypothetical protein TVAG_472680 [Trichomonas vaginalis G3]|uniref:Ricin B lectin domain-containing protein n=1 Tax=Trichomonas vaginalis (strain ATCC PRA-98 / G3) TaxID=412133 RepID=A2FU95_TRIV3|nr:hypothetical protein TVAGG3_0447990 [Trichomonas vaginalis G3]EAX91526.1 hypothetical protein TVAG_472680 [Trichomonas vaginalis G3]KAI5537946.1 hypothetical protein TVAGG3_0447990 [Trichomonas vaginalis G3]|eukprot:XP_001304456.1 hypothetical protein [Trichomonas vaginalis G3]